MWSGSLVPKESPELADVGTNIVKVCWDSLHIPHPSPVFALHKQHDGYKALFSMLLPD